MPSLEFYLILFDLVVARAMMNEYGGPSVNMPWPSAAGNKSSLRQAMYYLKNACEAPRLTAKLHLPDMEGGKKHPKPTAALSPPNRRLCHGSAGVHNRERAERFERW